MTPQDIQVLKCSHCCISPDFDAEVDNNTVSIHPEELKGLLADKPINCSGDIVYTFTVYAHLRCSKCSIKVSLQADGGVVDKGALVEAWNALHRGSGVTEGDTPRTEKEGTEGVL